MNDKYPQLNLRLKAAMLDSIIFGTILYTTAYFSHDLFPDDLYLRLMMIFIPTLSYEPILLRLTGSTIGHRVNKINVINNNELKKLNIFQCYFRFILKILLGTFSLVFMFFTNKRQSFHDLMSNTLVVFQKK